MPTFDKIRISPAAKDLVDRALARASTDADRARVKDVLVKAAEASGNRSLSVAEARAVLDAFETAAGGAAGALAPDQLGQGVELAFSNLGSMASLSNVDGVSVDFTTQGSLEKKLVSELEGAVAAAAGRKMDVNMMIFEFQSDGVEKAIVDLAKANPNVTFRIIGDSGQASDSGGNALPSILRQKLPNVQVKYKKDFPYVWDEAGGRPRYNHGATQGLNHHKGFATFIEGRPDRLVAGSFNWSNTADEKNYEDLTTFHAVDASTRRAVVQYGEEFVGYWNNPDAALTPNAFADFKKQKWDEMLVAHNRRPTGGAARPSDALPAYALDVKVGVDANGYRLSDLAGLKAALGAQGAKDLIADRKKYGRYDSVAELRERVPSLAQVPEATLAALDFGAGHVSINNASMEELDQLGFTRRQAQAIVKYRDEHGDFDAVSDLTKVPGVTASRVAALEGSLTAVDVEAFFNSRPYGAPAGGTGYGPAGARTTPAAGPAGTVDVVKASVTVGATDLFNRAKPGDTVNVAMYGMSGTSPEYKSLADAARRGVKVRVVLNDDFTASTVAALKGLAAQGLPVEVRVQKAKTMHEKFGVVGDDVFFGSANFSESSSTKHSEDRFTVKNHRELAERFAAQFELLWARSRPQ